MLKNGLTLNETWKKCLEMWHWIAEVELGNPKTYHTETLKERWLRDNFGRKYPSCGCFFCDYDEHHNDNCLISCPASLVDEDFDCSNEPYNYADHPVTFYNKLVELNEIRLRRK
jgi:hypothetical protein